MTRHVLPYPIVSLALLVLWLLLNQSLSPAHLALGTCLAIGGGLTLKALDPIRALSRRPMSLVILGWLVFLDIVRSNIAVARIIFGVRLATITSGFVEIPLQLRASHGLAALAIIITATPGTIWVDYDSPTGVLTI